MRGSIASLVAVLLFAGAPASGGGVDLGPGREISYFGGECPLSGPSCERDTEAEVNLAVDPSEPDNAIAVFQQGRYADSGGAVASGYSTTVDGGGTWHAGSLPHLTHGAEPAGAWHRSSDPAVAFDVRHDVVLYNALAMECLVPVQLCSGEAITVSRSTDDGLTFGTPYVVHAGSGDDKNWITVDNSASSPFFGRAYVFWTWMASIWMSTSDDGGSTWSAPRWAFQGLYPQPVVRPDGTVVVVHNFDATVSTDGGATWEPRRPVANPTFSPSVEGYESTAGLRAGNFASVAADPVTGDVWAVWQDLAPGGAVNHVFASVSPDGRTWSSRIDVTADAPTGLDHFTPTVTAEAGDVIVTSRTHLAGPAAGVGIEARCLGGGRRELYALPSLTPFSAVATPGFFYGEYMGLGMAGGRVYAAWPQAGAFTDPPVPSTRHQRTFGAFIDAVTLCD